MLTKIWHCPSGTEPVWVAAVFKITEKSARHQSSLQVFEALFVIRPLRVMYIIKFTKTVSQMNKNIVGFNFFLITYVMFLISSQCFGYLRK